MSFQVGDRIRVVAYEADDANPVGQLGTVVEHEFGEEFTKHLFENTPYIPVELEEAAPTGPVFNTPIWLFQANEIELIEQAVAA